MSLYKYDIAIEPEELLAERKYQLPGDGRLRYLIVRIGTPRKAEGDYYICKVEIEDESSRCKAFGGEDAMEALLSALTFIGVSLWAMGSPDHWEGKRDGCCNFPMPNFREQDQVD